MKFLGIVGKKNSGKDSAYMAIANAYPVGDIMRVSFADELKREICEQLAADPMMLEGVKNLPPFRQLLQSYGVWRRSQIEGYWIHRAMLTVSNMAPSVKLVVFTDCRFLNEAKYIRDLKGALVRIERKDLIDDDTHSSETEQQSIGVDCHIHNDNTKLRLEKLIVDYVKSYILI